MYQLGGRKNIASSVAIYRGQEFFRAPT
jgi:hypothetical protein